MAVKTSNGDSVTVWSSNDGERIYLRTKTETGYRWQNFDVINAGALAQLLLLSCKKAQKRTKKVQATP